MPDVTAIVVCHNEAAVLPRCLASLSFCREIIVVDKASADDSAAVARAAGARVLAAPRDPPFVEVTRAEVAPLARHDWLLFLDPDETLPPALATDFDRLMAAHPAAGVFGLPMRYFFRGRPLRHGFWGREDMHLPRLVHRDRVSLVPRIHRGVVVKPGFESIRIPATGANRIRHDWAHSYREVWAKHQRHLSCEEHTRDPSLRAGARGFWRSFVLLRGWRDGWRGFVLSLLYAHYVLRIGGPVRR